MIPRPVRALAIDMDGLLLDTEHAYHRTMRALAAELGHDLPAAHFHRMIGTTTALSQAIMRERCGADFDVEAFDAETERRMDEIEIGLRPGVLQLFDTMDEQGLPACLVTSNSRAIVERRLGRYGLLDRFAATVVGGEAARGKPHPEPFLLAARRLGLPPAEILALEDSHNGVRSAHAAGMMAVMVPDLLEATGEMRSLCIWVATDLHEVCGMLTSSPS